MTDGPAWVSIAALGVSVLTAVGSAVAYVANHRHAERQFRLATKQFRTATYPKLSASLDFDYHEGEDLPYLSFPINVKNLSTTASIERMVSRVYVGPMPSSLIPAPESKNAPKMRAKERNIMISWPNEWPHLAPNAEATYTFPDATHTSKDYSIETAFMGADVPMDDYTVASSKAPSGYRTYHIRMESFVIAVRLVVNYLPALQEAQESMIEVKRFLIPQTKLIYLDLGLPLDGVIVGWEAVNERDVKMYLD